MILPLIAGREVILYRYMTSMGSCALQSAPTRAVRSFFLWGLEDSFLADSIFALPSALAFLSATPGPTSYQLRFMLGIALVELYVLSGRGSGLHARAGRGWASL